MITYNHEKFIEQSLDSVLMQQVDFEYEIVIGDDLSQDKTREILSSYQRKHPDKISLLMHESNLGPGGNIQRVINSCQGEYIALLEGDDFWTSPHKLKKQVDFMEANPDFALSWHPVIAYSEEKKQFERTISKISGDIYTLEDLLDRRIFPITGAVVYRNVVEFPTWLSTLRYCDYAIFLLIAHHGLLKYFDELMGCYREHRQGVWGGESAAFRAHYDIAEFEALNKHYDYKYEDYLNLRVLYGGLARAYQEAGQSSEAKKYYRKFLKSPHGGRINIATYIKTFLAVYVPWTVPLWRSLRDGAHNRLIALKGA